MDSDLDLDIISEILQGVSVINSSFGPLYFKHLLQHEQRDIISKTSLLHGEAVSKGLQTEEEALADSIHQEMWTQEEEDLIKKYESEIKSLNNVYSQIVLPSQKKKMVKEIEDKNVLINNMRSDRSGILGLTCEKYVNNAIQKIIVESMLFYDKEYKNPVFDSLYINEQTKEIQMYVFQKDFFSKFQDKNISKAVLSGHFSLYLPFCEDVIGVFGQPLKNLTNFQLKLISYARYFLSIFKNSSEKIPENVAKDPDLLIGFYENQHSDSRKVDHSGREGASTYFGADKEDIELLKKNGESVVNLSEEIKKKGGSLNMKEMMALHGN